MQKVLGDFIHALRHAGLPISSAETLDALRAAQLVGIDNASLLKHSLGMTLTKRLEHRLTYEQIFDQYFNSHDQLKEGYQIAPEPPSQESLSQESLSETIPSLNSSLAQQLMNSDMSAMQVMIT
ncbi:MAG: hypothetical protein ACKVJE_21575, partial [Pseudomonadales bacterium]